MLECIYGKARSTHTDKTARNVMQQTCDMSLTNTSTTRNMLCGTWYLFYSRHLTFYQKYDFGTPVTLVWQYLSAYQI